MMKCVRLFAAALALATALGAAAQKVYRCGPDGRIYQQTPCAEGRPVDASDPRTAEQRQAAQTVAKNEAKMAAQLDQDATEAPVKGRKGKPAPTPASKEPAASSAKAQAKKADANAKPPVYLVPKPKEAASAPKK
jgi:hypothetical protein